MQGCWQACCRWGATTGPTASPRPWCFGRPTASRSAEQSRAVHPAEVLLRWGAALAIRAEQPAPDLLQQGSACEPAGLAAQRSAAAACEGHPKHCWLCGQHAVSWQKLCRCVRVSGRGARLRIKNCMYLTAMGLETVHQAEAQIWCTVNVSACSVIDTCVVQSYM